MHVRKGLFCLLISANVIQAYQGKEFKDVMYFLRAWKSLHHHDQKSILTIQQQRGPSVYCMSYLLQEQSKLEKGKIAHFPDTVIGNLASTSPQKLWRLYQITSKLRDIEYSK